MRELKFKAPVGKEGLYVLNTSTWRSKRPVMDKEKCVECGLCLVYCPVFSIKRDENKSYYICYDFCKGCGLCARECPQGAIAMVMEGEDVK
jgi:2-oxoacid:acceptor oxidoreductase delta subunit (pyruvate/2-ketoisovalerate family)